MGSSKVNFFLARGGKTLFATRIHRICIGNYKSFSIIIIIIIISHYSEDQANIWGLV